MNRTLMERVRCMMSLSGVEKHFWAEAVTTTAYLINKCPVSGIGGDIPAERWYGGKSEYMNLKPFGCKAYAHKKHVKLSARVVKCIMLGYPRGVKGYRLWCIEPNNGKIVLSRDVAFMQDEMHLLHKEVEAGSSSADRAVEAQFEVENDCDPIGVEESQQPEINIEQGPSTPQSYRLARDRPRRQNVQPPARFSDYHMLSYALHIAEQLEFSEPMSYEEAMRSPEREQWIQAMKEELESLISNKTWIQVEKDESRKIIGYK